MGTRQGNPIDKVTLERLAQFRYQVRRFLRVSEEQAKAAGITALQYQLMLQSQGFAGRDWASIGELAERLQAQPHGVVALVTRCEQVGLVQRHTGRADRRLVEVHLTPKGRRLLERIAGALESERSALAAVVGESLSAREAARA